jgi:hypothetical protein
MRISILETTAAGSAVYVETHTPTTNANGLVTIEIGTGTVVSGDFSAIVWATNSFFTKTQIDPTGGTSYSIEGTSELLSVPYALYAKTSGSSAGPQGATGADGALIYVTESENTGVRLSKSNADNYGDIGENAVDLSYSNSAKNEKGATGNFSTAMGDNTEASGSRSTAMGNSTKASGLASTAMGERTIASDYASLVIGQNNASGATVTNSANNFNLDNTAFVIGNGENSNNKSDAFKVLFNGNTTISGSLELEGAVTTSGNITASGFTTTAGVTLNAQSSGTNAGDMQYWNGNAWIVVDATPNEGAALQMIGGIPTWVGGTPPVPDAPTIGTATAGSAQASEFFTASVSFTAPVSDGGSPITEYTATSNPGGFTGTGSSPIAVTGLSNGTAYTFRVTATNASGTSKPSSASNSWTPRLIAVTIGEKRDGGMVFWVDPKDSHKGLVCALEDQSSGIRWHNGSFVQTSATGTAIGTGAANTTAIIDVQGATQTAYAAGLARAHTGGGYTDWFLPSKDELNEMYDNKATLEAGDGFTPFSSYYWSSTEFGTNGAWVQNFASGNQSGNYKSITNVVRAVRAF